MTSCGGGSASGEREREQGKGMRARESARGSGWLRGVVRGIEGDEKGARQAGREVAWRGGARARWARSVPLSGRKTTEEGGPGGLGRLLAGPAFCGWAAQGEAPGKPLLFISVFYFFADICFDLIKY